jgi:hypothetical protein
MGTTEAEALLYSGTPLVAIPASDAVLAAELLEEAAENLRGDAEALGLSDASEGLVLEVLRIADEYDAAAVRLNNAMRF